MGAAPAPARRRPKVNAVRRRSGNLALNDEVPTVTSGGDMTTKRRSSPVSRTIARYVGWILRLFPHPTLEHRRGPAAAMQRELVPSVTRTVLRTVDTPRTR